MASNISLDLLLSPEVCRLLDSFAATMKIRAVFFSRSGKILKRGRDSDNSCYCQLMQEKYFGIGKCRQLDDAMQKKALKTESICCYKCHAGLNEIIAPVKIFGEVAGFVALGQFRMTDEIPEFIGEDTKTGDCFLQLPKFTNDELSGLEDLIKLLIEYIIGKELVYYAEGLRYQKIMHYLEQHFSEQVSLKDLANFVGISESLLSRFLRNEHQTTFKNLLTNKRLEAAEELWRSNPELSVGEVAQQIGYDDQHYFSRVYRKVRGITPGEFKRNRLKK